MKKSHPMWVRGLKRALSYYRLAGYLVAPYVGAWIETLSGLTKAHLQASHPMWVRGLKQRFLALLRIS